MTEGYTVFLLHSLIVLSSYTVQVLILQSGGVSPPSVYSAPLDL